MKKDKNEAKLPLKLGYLLELINLVEPEELLPLEKPDLGEKKLSAEMSKTTNSFEEKIEDQLEDIFNTIAETVLAIKQQTGKYPNLLEDISRLLCLIKEIEYDPADIIGLWINYKEFIEIRPKLWVIALGQEVVGRFGGTDEAYRMYYRDITFETNLEYTKDGKFGFERNVIELALRNVKANRLRICKYCRRIFWANRTDKFGCTKKCNQNIRGERTRKSARKRDAERFHSRVNKNELPDQ